MNKYSELSAFRIHSMLLDSIVKLTSAVRKEGQAFCNPLEHDLKESIKASDSALQETLNLAHALWDKASVKYESIESLVQNNPA